MMISNGIKRDYSSNEALLKHPDSPDSLQNPVTLLVTQPGHLAMGVEEDVSRKPFFIILWNAMSVLQVYNDIFYVKIW